MARRAFISAPQTPISLLARLHDGTNAEWRRFVELYGPFVYRLALAAGLDTHDAEDVSAVVIGRLVRRLRRGFTLDPAKGRFRAYVVTVVAREARRFRRRAGSAPRSDKRRHTIGEMASSPEEHLARLERIERLRVCLHRLRDDGRVRRRDLRAFEDYVLKELPAADVARRYRLKTARVYGIKSEMLQRIAAMMDGLDRELGEV